MTLPKGWTPGGGIKEAPTFKKRVCSFIMTRLRPFIIRLRPFIMFVLAPIILIIIALLILPIHTLNILRTEPAAAPINPMTELSDKITTHIVINFIIPVLSGYVLFRVSYRKLYNDMLDRLGKPLKWKKEEREPLVDAKFFNCWGNENAVAEFNYIEKIAYIGIPIMVLLNSIYYISILNDYDQSFWENNFEKFFGNIPFERFELCIIILNIFFLPLSLFFIFILSRSFRFYLAKASMMVAKDKMTQLERMKYTMVGVKAYSKFLTRNLNLQLDEPKIYSKIMATEKPDYDKLVDSFNTDSDKLKPLRIFAETIPNNPDLVLKVTKAQLAKDSIEFIIGILPIVFGIMAILLPAYTTYLDFVKASLGLD